MASTKARDGTCQADSWISGQAAEDPLGSEMPRGSAGARAGPESLLDGVSMSLLRLPARIDRPALPAARVRCLHRGRLIGQRLTEVRVGQSQLTSFAMRSPTSRVPMPICRRPGS